MGCLEAVRAEAAAVAGRIAAGDAAVLVDAARAASAITAPDRCGPALLLGPSAPSRDGARGRAIGAAERALGGAQALRDLGLWTEAADHAAAALGAARETAYGPLIARALVVRGELEDRVGHIREAETTLTEGLAIALASRDDASAAHALTTLTTVTGYRAARPDEGLKDARMAEALIDRLGGDPLLKAALAFARGVVLRARADYAGAAAAFDRALALRRERYGELHPEVADALTELGYTFREAGDYARARDAITRALKMRERLLGPDHPEVAQALNVLGAIERRSGRVDEALGDHARALAILERSLGPDHLETGYAVHYLGNVRAYRGEWREALPLYQRELQIGVATLGPDHPEIGMAHSDVGTALLHLGRLEEARRELEQGRAIIDREGDHEHPYLAEILALLSNLERRAGHASLAVELARRAAEIAERRLGSRHQDLGDPLDALGAALLAAGRIDEARPVLGRALGLRRDSGAAPWKVAETERSLAEAERGTGRVHR
jgi:tetratricopeptide (TPR) repeat protein